MTDTWRETSTAYYAVAAPTFDEAAAKVSEYTHEQLVHVVLNEHLNDWAREVADIGDSPLVDIITTHNTGGKRIPYIGWYYRNVDWAGLSVPIADCGDFIGICENNKWGYDQRYLEPDEAKQVIALLWEAKRIDNDLEATERAMTRDAKLREVWDLFQTFAIPPAAWR